MTKLLLISLFSVLIIIAGTYFAKVISDKHWSRHDSGLGVLTKTQLKKIQDARITPEYLKSKEAHDAVQRGINDALGIHTNFPKDIQLRSINKHLKHIDYSLAVIAAHENDSKDSIDKTPKNKHKHRKKHLTLGEMTPEQANKAWERVGRTISDKEFQKMVDKASSNL